MATKTTGRRAGTRNTRTAAAEQPAPKRSGSKGVNLGVARIEVASPKPAIASMRQHWTWLGPIVGFIGGVWAASGR